MIPSDDLYGGGPAYPLSSLSVRVRAKPTDSTTILADVFDDNPGGGAFDNDAQELDKNGAKFNLNTGALFIVELQYATRVGNVLSRDVSRNVMAALRDRDLIAAGPRSPTLGASYTYVTTKAFLGQFGFASPRRMIQPRYRCARHQHSKPLSFKIARAFLGRRTGVWYRRVPRGKGGE